LNTQKTVVVKVTFKPFIQNYARVDCALNFTECLREI